MPRGARSSPRLLSSKRGSYWDWRQPPGVPETNYCGLAQDIPIYDLSVSRRFRAARRKTQAHPPPPVGGRAPKRPRAVQSLMVSFYWFLLAISRHPIERSAPLVGRMLPQPPADKSEPYGFNAKIWVTQFAAAGEGASTPEYWFVPQTTPGPVPAGAGSGDAPE